MKRIRLKKGALLSKPGDKLNQIEKKNCGELLGQGLYRDVYVLKGDPRFVIKIERSPGRGQFANVMEWRHWIDNQEWTWLSRWLAPAP